MRVMLLDLRQSTHHIGGRGAGDINLLFVMQLDASHGDLVSGTQQAAGRGEAFAAARA